MTDNTGIKDINMNDLTVEDFLELKKKFDDAENDTTPFAIVDDNEDIRVVGDVTNTEVKKADYVIQFAYRNTPQNKETLEEEKIFNETENYIGVERVYKDAWVSPRRFTTVQATLIQLYKFFNAVTPDGQIRDLTPDECLVALHTMNDEMVDAMCMVVAETLGIPPEDAQYILVTSAVAACMKIAQDFPEIINGVDFTTDKSSEKN